MPRLFQLYYGIHHVQGRPCGKSVIVGKLGLIDWYARHAAYHPTAYQVLEVDAQGMPQFAKAEAHNDGSITTGEPFASEGLDRLFLHAMKSDRHTRGTRRRRLYQDERDLFPPPQPATQQAVSIPAGAVKRWYPEPGLHCVFRDKGELTYGRVIATFPTPGRRQGWKVRVRFRGHTRNIATRRTIAYWQYTPAAIGGKLV